jgi:hypothetical protein
LACESNEANGFRECPLTEGATMEDTERLRAIANSIIDSSDDDTKIKTAAELLTAVSEIERKRAEARKLVVEEKQLSADLEDIRSRRASDSLKTLISLLAPVFTTLVLAGTLALQSYQFLESEKSRRGEAKRLTEVAEDARWTDAVKLLSQSEKLSPAGALLKSFVKSDRYGPQAYQTALQILVKTEDATVFESLFTLIFDPVSWANLSDIADINRAVYSNKSPLIDKAWDPAKGVIDLTRLNDGERQKYNSFDAELTFLSAKLVLILKGARPQGVTVDLSSTDLFGDLRGIDLNGAKISSANFSFTNVESVNLSGIIDYEGARFANTAWWEASAISQGLLEYLVNTYPYDSNLAYFRGKKFAKAQYDVRIALLKQPSNH